MQSSFGLLEEYDKVWIRQAILKAAKMYILKKFSFYNKYEESIIHKKWGFICLFSEGTHIKTRLGEPTSSAFAKIRNNRRKIAFMEIRALKKRDTG